MEQYWLPCPSCGKKNAVGPSLAGQEIRCTCGRAVAVPPLRDLRLLEPVPEEQARKQPASVWNKGSIITFIGILVLIFGLGMGFVFWYTRPRPVPVALLTPAQCWDLWQRFQAAGLPRRYVRTDPFVQEMQARRLWYIFAGVLCFIGVALILSARWVPILFQEPEPPPQEDVEEENTPESIPPPAEEFDLKSTG
jgi:hypothetical protein